MVASTGPAVSGSAASLQVQEGKGIGKGKGRGKSKKGQQQQQQQRDRGAVEKLVVTLELHVRPDLGDDEVLRLTRWAWEKCAGALGGTKGKDDVGKDVPGKGVGDGPEVTVGVVRG